MKVLFAVNDENISASIVKKYQKQYKEIISYKNVYYFNAIFKELQRNKTYDRVVISEDLEEFTSSSYEQKDKFIFDRLDSISDEAVSSNGADIPIILICSERRTKSEDILVKLFGIGIYNAIIGDDRSTDEVCRLIYKPRAKKEAKIYYKIDSENVNYEKENESYVNEVEMQNILMHFKKLGKSEDRYVESFSNIASQYNDAQLKVIIAVLPNAVKSVLAEHSPEYQRIVFPKGINLTGINKEILNKPNSPKKVKTNNKKGTSEKLLEVDSNRIMTRPVVVPTTMEKNMYKKVETKKKIDFVPEEDEDDDDLVDVQTIIEETPRKRGRGRPRKNPIVDETNKEPQKPRKRGRPRKNPVEELPKQETIEDSAILPGFEEDDIEENNSNIKLEQKPYEDIEENEFDNILPGVYSDQEEKEYESNDFEDDDENQEYYNEDEEYNNTSNFNKVESKENYNEEDDNEIDFIAPKKSSINNTIPEINTYRETQSIDQYNNTFEEGELESLLSSDKKVMTFVGTSKNGTSFIVNNIAQILSNMGINTAILDATQNKNAYYIYTKNDEDLRKIAVNSIENLINEVAQGIKVNNNLTVYTCIPDKNEEINNSKPILETLIRNHSVILIDCDFDTPVEYFENSQEIYLIQSMDVLTIQPLTAFLRELKVKNALDERKIRIILNKILRVKGLNGKNIVGGMSNYNDPEMSFMTELFDRNTVKIAGQLLFDEDVYARYLESLIECEIKINGYPKDFKARLVSLAEVIYPLLPKAGAAKKNKKEKRAVYNNNYTNSFSAGMNNTLDNMRKKY